jgi:hypothetical protein
MRLVSVILEGTGRRCYINPALVEDLMEHIEYLTTGGDVAKGTWVHFASGQSIAVEESIEKLASFLEAAQ